MNVNLQFLALQHNHLSKVEGVKHLKHLSFLDLSFNSIEDFSPLEFPENIMILKMHGNPCCEMKSDYRKSLVLRLNHLEELDRVKVVQAERLAYKGLIKIDVNNLLDKYKKERQENDTQDRIESELYLEKMEAMG